MDRDVIWDEISLLQSSLITIWRAYMRWFSWHFGIHIGVLGAALSVSALREHAAGVALFMGAFSVLGIGAAFRMHAYDNAVRMRASAIRDQDAVSNDVLLGGNILRYARRATLTSNILIIG